jgi:pimeloyl-ACP methyl ester carboxylesterase
LRAEGITRVSVAGISLGGLIAHHFAAYYPQYIDRLVLIDTTPRYSDELRAMWVERAKTARTVGVGAMVPNLLKIWFSDACLARDPPGVRYVRETLLKNLWRRLRPRLRGARRCRPARRCGPDPRAYTGYVRRGRYPELPRLGPLARQQHNRRQARLTSASAACIRSRMS